ncbi:diguanylate phosphodiesterase [Hypericibacter terrae]|uniref:Diguanylate phosphodiesterase n=2 Tax=Hypericibacter terrae TaxID=2602015 RepID=A0A5J6MJY7_9PROT|nr:diguanylate phosphodiesterase [Hypericibacter terrae]
MIRHLVAEIAQTCGWETFDTGDPEVFEAEVRRRPPAAVVLDLVMPNVDGIEVLRELAAVLTGIPILILSGMDGRLLETAMQLGQARGLTMAGCIQKPFRADALSALLQKVASCRGEISEAMLEEAVEREELDLHYQPYLDLQSRRIIGAEALVRWQHPQRGPIPPSAFIPMAEKSALIGKVTDLVLAKAVAQAARWNDRLAPLDISINLSARSIQDVTFPEQILRLCRQHSLNPARIVFEITETAAMQDPVMLMDVLTRLRLKGIRLSIDDFGTGYSSLAQLRRLPFSELKIDLSFVSTMMASRDSEIIVKTIIDMARNLGLRTVAEGVETPTILERLGELGCNVAQGYLIGRPMTAPQIPSFLGNYAAAQ